MPSSYAWTLRQKALIVFAAILGIAAFGALVYTYERYHRGLSEADLAGTWTRVDSAGSGRYYDFRRDGTIVPLDDDGQPTDLKGKWYAGGPNIYVRFPPLFSEDPELVIWHIVDVSRDQFRVSLSGKDDKEPAVWRRMKPVPRPPVDLSEIPAIIEEVKINP